MLVLNPKWSPSLPSYAYRVGFSEYELKLLQQQVGYRGVLALMMLSPTTNHM